MTGDANPERVVFHLALADLPPGQVEDWWWYTHDPDEVRLLVDAGIDPVDAAYYRGFGLASSEMATMFGRALHDAD